MTTSHAVLHNLTFSEQGRRLQRPQRSAVTSPPDQLHADSLHAAAVFGLPAALNTPPDSAIQFVTQAAPPQAAHHAVPAPPPAIDQSAVDAAWKQGRQNGYDAGYQEGIRQAKRDGQQEVERLAHDLSKQQVIDALKQAEQQAHAQLQQQYESLTALLQNIPVEFNHYLQKAEDDMLSLVYEVVCRVLGNDAASLSGLRSQLQHCLKAWHGRAMLSVHLHPQDMALVQTDDESTQLLRGAGFSMERSSLRWVADPKITLGGCQFRSSEGALDARLEVQLQALKATLLNTRASRQHLLDIPPLERTA